MIFFCAYFTKILDCTLHTIPCYLTCIVVCITDYLSDYCVPLSDVPVYTTAPISTSPPRDQMIPFGWIALIAVIVALLLIIVVFVIYNSCKKSRGSRRYSPNSGPDAERLMATSPSVQSTAAGGASAAAAAGEGGTAGSAAQLVSQYHFYNHRCKCLYILLYTAIFVVVDV